MAVIDCRVCATPLPAEAKYCLSCGVDVTDPGATVRVSPADHSHELQERLTKTLAGRYEVQKLLGAGGMAAVYLANELGLDRLVAIKVLPPELSRDESLVARFRREAITAAKLDHPHIIPIYRVESEAGLHYFVMKYVPGRSLESLLESTEAIPLNEATRILSEAAQALGHAHTRGVVHRDVKPANIMLDRDGRVVLTDFGISKAGEGTQLTQAGTIMGTPDYMAPEQVIGTEVDGRADQYSLGVVAYEMFTGECPFTGDSAHTILYRHVHEAPKPVAALRPDVPAHVVETIAIALSKQPSDRFATMDELARALSGDRSVVAARPNSATVVVTRAIRKPPRKFASRQLVATTAVGALLIAGVWLYPFRRDVPAASPTLPPAPAPTVRVDSTGGQAPAQDSTPIVPQGTARTKHEPAPVPATPRTSRPKAQTERPDRNESEQTATLTIASEPYGVLYIDDVEIGDTPVANRSLKVGRSYRIRVEREGYRPKRETIAVTGPNAIRRNYVLEPGGTP